MHIPFILYVILAFVAATTSIVTALSSHDQLGEPRHGNALRAAALFSLAAGILTLGGGWIGQWLLGMMKEDARWIADIFWFVVGLKMLLSSRKMPAQTYALDMSQLTQVVMVALANGLNAMLMAIGLALAGEMVQPFTIYVSLFVLILSWLGFFIPGIWPIAGKQARWLFPVAGILLILITLIRF